MTGSSLFTWRQESPLPGYAGTPPSEGRNGATYLR